MARCREMETTKKMANELMQEIIKMSRDEMATAGDAEKAMEATMIGGCANTAGIDLMSKPMPESRSIVERYNNNQ